MARCLGQLMLGNNDVARCDFVWRKPRLKRHLPGRLPYDANDFASISSATDALFIAGLTSST